MPWTQDGSGGLANANGVSAVIATRRTGRIANENLRQSVVSLYSMDSGYPSRRILSSNFGFCEGPNVALGRVGARRPRRSLDWHKILPFEADAANDRLGWVGLEAARCRARGSSRGRR